MLKKKKTAHLVFIIGSFVAILCAFLPYIDIVTWDKVNDSSEFIEDTSLYETLLIGYESGFYLFNILVLGLVVTIYIFTTKKWVKFLLIPVGMAYLFIQFILLISFEFSFGKPYADSSAIGYMIMLIITVLFFIETVFKPIKGIQASKEDLLDD